MVSRQETLTMLTALRPIHGGQSPKAVEYATRACELSSWNDPVCLGVLAAAHAEVGKFEDAVKWQLQALESAQLGKEEREKAQARLKLYEKGKPYRDTSPYRF